MVSENSYIFVTDERIHISLYYKEPINQEKNEIIEEQNTHTSSPIPSSPKVSLLDLFPNPRAVISSVFLKGARMSLPLTATVPAQGAALELSNKRQTSTATTKGLYPVIVSLKMNKEKRIVNFFVPFLVMK